MPFVPEVLSKVLTGIPEGSTGPSGVQV